MQSIYFQYLKFRHEQHGSPSSTYSKVGQKFYHDDDIIRSRYNFVAVATKEGSRANPLTPCFSHVLSPSVTIALKSVTDSDVDHNRTFRSTRNFALDQQSLEKTQRRATKLIPTLQHVPYTDRLVLLKLPSLQYRRWRGGMILM